MQIKQIVRSNENMSSRNQRINKGISTLVHELLVDIPGEDATSREKLMRLIL
jgi:hypothetical protein